MQVIGLTGGIGTGKSTASKLIKEIDVNLIIIDADHLSHEATKKGNLPYFILKTIVLPKDCFHPITQELIRPRLAELIFAQTPRAKLLRKNVERCIHPWVILKMIIAIIWNWLRGEDFIILDVPLLFEANLEWMCTKTILIDTSQTETQIERILKRNPEITENEAKNRIYSQFPMEKKRKLSNLVLKNDGNFKDLKTLLEREFKGKNIKNNYFNSFYRISFIILIIFTFIFINKLNQ